MINRKAFYDYLRGTLFQGKLAQGQVDGMEAILNEWEKRGYTDLRWLAYMMGTAFHETGKTMRPIEEYGKGKGRRYGIPDPITGHIYYGRGFVQITWKGNYANMSKLLNVDLVNFPHLALRIDIATQIMFEGMLTAASSRGDFTGRSLEQYFNATTEDWYNARKIINGLDCASLIANYAKTFFKALTL